VTESTDHTADHTADVALAAATGTVAWTGQTLVHSQWAAGRTAWAKLSLSRQRGPWLRHGHTVALY